MANATPTAPAPGSTPSGAPPSQLAWQTMLNTGFNDFTEEQKFLRKVSEASMYQTKE